MKVFTKTTLITGIAFGVPMGLLFGILAGITIGIARGFSVGVVFGLKIAAISGLACSLLFGLAMASFVAIQRQHVSKMRPEFTGEHLLHDGPANHFLNGEGVGGYLYLTDCRLFFRSHKFNIQTHELSIPLVDILEIRPVRTAKIFPNGLRLVTYSGREERFVVEANRRWCDEVVKALMRE
jgi:GRAM domain